MASVCVWLSVLTCLHKAAKLKVVDAFFFYLFFEIYCCNSETAHRKIVLMVILPFEYFLRWISRGHCVCRRPCTLTVPFLYFPTTKSWIRGLRKDKITSPHTFALLFKTIYVVVQFLSAIKSFCHQVSFFLRISKKPFPEGCWSVFTHLKRFLSPPLLFTWLRRKEPIHPGLSELWMREFIKHVFVWHSVAACEASARCHGKNK